MANNYTLLTPDRWLPCSEEDYQQLLQMLNDDDDSAEEREAPNHGLYAHYQGGTLVLTHDESASIEGLSPETFQFIGRLIEKAGMPFWQFGQAFTCDKPRCGEFGGGYLRIYPSGWVEEAYTGWAECTRHFIIAGEKVPTSEHFAEYVTGDDEHQAMDRFIRSLYPGEELPEELLTPDDEELENPETGRPWVTILSVHEIEGRPLERYV